MTLELEPSLHHVHCLDAQGLHRMAYWQWGDPKQRHVVVCVHGLSRQGRDFDALARVLAPHVRVVCPDVVGRGRSDWLADPMGYQVPTYVADMVNLIARLDADVIDWVGTSMGGLIGIGVASRRTREGAGLVRRLVINDVGPTLDPAGLVRIGGYVGRAQSYASLDEAMIAVRSVSETFGPHSQAQWLDLTRWQVKRDDTGRYVPRSDPGIAIPFKAVTPALAQAGEALTWMAYDAISSSTLLVRGQDSDLLAPSTARSMTERGPKARLVEFPGVGHAPMLQHADQIEAVRRFLLDGAGG